MIIRMTIRDNDVMQDYIKFCTDREYYLKRRGTLFSQCTLLGAMFSDDEDPCSTTVKERKMHYLGNPHHHWTKADSEYQEIIEEIYRQWDIYAKDNKLESWMRPDIRIQYSVSEKDENGEVLYYFTCTNQYIIM